MARKMKDSGIEWIGEIPEGWEVLAHKYIMHKEKSICEHYSGEDVISLTLNGVVKRDLENPSGKMPTTFDGYQFVDPNDLLLCLFDIDVTPRCVGLVKDYGVTSPAYSRFKIHSGFCNAYYNYLLRFIDDEKVFVHLSKNLRSSLTESDFGAIKTIVPPKAEQQRIADYLDNRTFEIDTLSSKARSSIEEYKKLKQAVITQAVTKGVRGEREMKPTDFTRWSEIPFDWDLKRVKSCIASISSGLSAVTDDANSEESGKFVLRTSAVSSGFFVPTEVKPVLKSAVNRLICPVEPDTLIVSRMNTASMVGACAYVANNHPNTFLPDKLWKIKFLPSYHTKYMWYALNSVPAKSWFSELATGASSSMQNISINDFTSNYLPIPAFSEQKEIANYLDAKCAEIDGLIAKKEQLVKELESYKKSLIYEVVTGKREV